jgi:hypothetical protein
MGIYTYTIYRFKLLLSHVQAYHVFNQGNLEKFISIIHKHFIDFAHNFKGEMKMCCQNLCLLNYVQILSV